ncbi:3-methyl-adenine DNA glycosylase I [Bacteroidales bacterium]|nr:3-methyl-adenine DNA glycosylase I [Bacteroidales bacterium]
MDTKIRCSWCAGNELHISYHDKEWGKEVTDDKILFEFLILESAQAGLSWNTILQKREGYRNAFAQFDVKKVARFTAEDVSRLMEDSGIVRNRLKIQSSSSNAQLFMAVQQEFGSFNNYLRTFFPEEKRIVNHWKLIREVPTSTLISDAISKDMKKRGFKFMGTTICYAYLQAVGLVDDHLVDCFCRTELK